MARAPADLPFADRLLAWFDVHGRHDLPWQQPRTPYRVWISEIMLQQTQVATVIPYFERWMTAFPDLAALAAAEEDAVLAHWSGLGYYARARNILKAARRCMDEHGGRLPVSADALAALPGIGPSTANAIVSQSTDRPAAVLDGNVRRVLARHTATGGWTGSTKVQKALWAAAEDRLPDRRGADYTQAVMDLGALVCTRSKPACANCPVAGDCRALETGRVADLPTPRPHVRVGRKTLRMLVARDGRGRVLLEKRPGAGIWGGLWCLPEADPAEPDFEALRTLPPVEHRLSHLQLTIQPLLQPLLARPREAGRVANGADQGWFDRRQQARLGLPKPVSDLLDRLDKGEFS
jgi:A/G-specific adenine glycosylase